MKLNEVFQHPYPWKWSYKSKDDGASAQFVANDNNNVYMEFAHDGNNQWEIDFAREDLSAPFGNNVKADITGQGDAFRIFATLKEIIQAFIKYQDPDVLVFTAHENSRKDLYKSILPKLATLVNMDYDIKVPTLDPRIKGEPHHLFYLIKK